jgi:anti-anti-sigma factor
MLVERDTLNDILILRPVGSLDSGTSAELERPLTEALKAGTTRVIFDFSRLDYISSAGLRVVLLAGKRLRGTGKVALVGMNEMVRDVFTMSGFLTLFPATATVDEAVKLL